MGTSRSPIVISSDDEPVVASAISPVAHEQSRPAEGSRGNNVATQQPEWLPDAIVVPMESSIMDDLMDYTCPGGFTFNRWSDVEEYCSSGALQRAIDAQATLNDMTTLQGKYRWLREYPGFVIEIRAGGENLSKMFKFYAHLGRGVHIASNEDFMRYVHEGKIPEHTNEECDTCCEDNIIAQLEFKIDGLPPGWVKETTFRKCSNGIRKDSFYTDHVNKKVYRSLKAAVKSFRSGTNAGSLNPILSVTDMYFFDDCRDMLPCLANRLKFEEREGRQRNKEVGQNSCSMRSGTSAGFDQPQGKGNKLKTEKKRDKDAMATDASKPSGSGGRPRKS